MKLTTDVLIVSLFVLPLSGCEEKQSEKTVPGRWYTPSQVDSGRDVFRTHCASCHGKNAEGITRDWKKTLPDGSYPPPPLNGSAHAWHHPKSMLKRTIDKGGIPLGGTMPGFAGKLSDADKDAAIAFFQSYWKDNIYQGWIKRGGLE